MKQEVEAGVRGDDGYLHRHRQGGVVRCRTGSLRPTWPTEAQAAALAQAKELAGLAEARAAEMGSQTFTQLVDRDSGRLCLLVAREPGPDGMSHARHRQEGQPGRTCLVRPEDMHAGCARGRQRPVTQARKQKEE